MKKSNPTLKDIFEKSKSTYEKLGKFDNTLNEYWSALKRLEKNYFILLTVVVLIILWPYLTKYLEIIKNLYESSSPDSKLNLIFIIPLTAIVTLVIKWFLKKLFVK